MKQRFSQIICILTVLALMVAVLGCSRGSSSVRVKQQTAQVLTPGSGITVKSAADWASAHPDIYASYQRNADNSEFDDYVTKYPMIAVLYEGMGFAYHYNSARGHVYSLQDLDDTRRPHPFANCYACKTPDLHALINEIGDAAYAMSYAELKERMINPVSCFNCHANEPGTLILTHAYVAKAMGPDLNSVDPVKLACAQCHVEYHFDPVSRAVVLPYHDLASMTPEAMLKYYNDMDFADFVNPRSGVRQIKVQHPEFETLMGAGNVHAKDYSCSDCHMGTSTNSRGKSFINHEWRSPLKNPELVKNSCASCHPDLAGFIAPLQERVKARYTSIGAGLVDVTEGLVAAIARGHNNTRLDPIRRVARDAQFYWDFVFVENSDGAHNSRLTHQVLDKAEALMNEAKTMLAAL